MRSKTWLCFSTFAVRVSSLTSMTARLLELERITPTSVTTPVMHATMIDSIKNYPPRSRLSSPGRQCPPVSQAVLEACLSAMS